MSLLFAGVKIMMYNAKENRLKLHNMQRAERKWLHCEEDDADYNTTNLVGVDKNKIS